MTLCIEVITSPNCPHSQGTMRMAQKVVSKMDAVLLQEVSIVTPFGQEKAAEYGVTAFPSIVIDGKVAFVGVPEEDGLRFLIYDAVIDKRDRENYFF